MNKAGVGAGWVAALAVGWACGSQFASGPSHDAEPRASRINRQDLGRESPGDRYERLRELADLAHPRLEERMEMERHIARLPLEDLRRMAGVGSADENRSLHEMTEEGRAGALLRGMAIKEWSYRDPFGLIESGIHFERGDDPFDGGLESLAWKNAACSDPKRALELLAGIGFAYHQRTGVFQGLADATPDLAFSVARGLPLDQFESMEHSIVAEGFADPVLRLKWAELAFQRLDWRKQPVVYHIFNDLAEDDPEVFARAGHLPVLEEYAGYLSNILESQRLKSLPAGDPLADDFDGEDASGWDDRGRRIERWFAADPMAATAWIQAQPDESTRMSRLAELAHSAVTRDLQSLERVLDIFDEPQEREAVMRCAVVLLSDFNSSTKAALLDFVGRYPEARQYVSRPQVLEP